MHSVLLDVHIPLLLLDLTEQVADSLVLTRSPQLVEVTALLKQLNVLKDLAKILDELESIELNDAELNEGRQSYLSIVHTGLGEQVRADSTLVNLLNDQV